MIICIGNTKSGFQRLVIGNDSCSEIAEITCGFDLTKEDVEKLVKIALKMEKKFGEVKP